MSARTVGWLLTFAFSVAVAHAAMVIHCPVSPQKYRLGEPATAMSAANAESRQIYLRRTLRLVERPRHAWVKVLGRDQIRVYVNGRLVGQDQQSEPGAAVIADVTRQMQSGVNIIAVTASQSRVGRPPEAAVECGYVIGNREYRLAADDKWRCSDRPQRGAGWWFEPEFDDHHWQPPLLSRQTLSARVDMPPRAVTSAGIGRWITSDDFESPTSHVRRSWDIPFRPRSAWLRLTANAHYRLAVNGTVVDAQDQGWGTGMTVQPVMRTYDLTPVITHGQNVISLMLTHSGARPHLWIDFEAEGPDGARVAIGSDGDWQSYAGLTRSWLASSPHDSDEWHSCDVASEPGIVAWGLPRRNAEIALPSSWWVRRLGWELALIALVLITTRWIARQLANSLFEAMLTNRHRGETHFPSPLPQGGDRDVTESVPNDNPFVAGSARPPARVSAESVVGALHFALVLPTLAIAAAMLAAYDPRINPANLFQWRWLAAAVGMVPLQWIVLAALRNARRPRPAARRRIPQFVRLTGEKISLPHVLMGALVLTGFGLRIAGVDDDPLHPDETTMYRAVQGIYEFGFPHVRIHENLPPAPVATSEAVYYGPAIAELFFDDPRYVIRMPAVVFGTATILLIYFVAGRMFDPLTGLVAAGIYTFAPIPIAMTNFGRYFSQLQFFTLLTISLYYRLIAGNGPLNRRVLWLAAASFVVMFLSWEGAAVIAAGMVLACLAERRGRLQTILCNPAVWMAVVAVGSVMVLQHGHRQLHQAGTLWFGTGARDIALTPMWQFPQFEPSYYVWASGWQHSALLPVLGLIGAVFMAMRHAQAPAVRYLLIVFLTNAALFSLVLPVKAVRYGYHLMPLMILLNAAVAVAILRRLTDLCESSHFTRREAAASTEWQTFARAVAAVCLLGYLLLCNGTTLRSGELNAFTVSAPAPGELRVAEQRAATHYLLEHLQPGDVVLALSPHVVEHEWKLAAADAGLQKGAVHYWIESRLQLQPALDDVRTMTLHRLSGTQMISSVEELDTVFARHRRIWYLTSPTFHGKLNVAGVSSYLRQHMEPVFEDYHTLVLFRGDNHRPAQIRLRDEDAHDRARANLLP